MPPLSPAILAALGASAPAGAGTPPGAPPFGSTGMTPPVPPHGLQAEGASLVAEAVKMLQAAIAKPGMGAETKLGQAILKALEGIGRELPDGSVTPGMRNAGMEQWMLQRRQTNPMEAIAAAIGGPGAGAPPPPPPPGAGIPPPPGGPMPAI